MDTIGRIENGLRMVKLGRVEDVGVVKMFKVRGDQGRVYDVTKREDGTFTCTCPDFEHRTHKCKHIWAVSLKEDGDL